MSYTSATSKFMHILCTSSSSQLCKLGVHLSAEHEQEVGYGRNIGSHCVVPHESKDSLLCGEGVTVGEPELAQLARGTRHHLLVNCTSILTHDHISSSDQPCKISCTKCPFFSGKKVRSERETDLSTVTQLDSGRWDFEPQGHSLSPRPYCSPCWK